MSGVTVCAVVVTHDRRELLGQCLEAVLGQTRAPDEVLVLDNASTDGTAAFVGERFPGATLVSLATNEGSSGGFHAGMSWACERGYDWLWVMDDDTIPADDALAELLRAPDTLDGLPEPVMLASKVVWTDGSMHPMNHPNVNLGDMDRLVRGLELQAMPIRWTTFPSLLVRREAIERHGLPRKSFFIWGDDIDFTARILRHQPGYLVPSSVAEHRTATAHRPWEGGPRFYYAVRNALFIRRGDALAPKERVAYALLMAEHARQFLIRERFRPASIAVVLRGLLDGVVQRVR